MREVPESPWALSVVAPEMIHQARGVRKPSKTVGVSSHRVTQAVATDVFGGVGSLKVVDMILHDVCVEGSCNVPL